ARLLGLNIRKLAEDTVCHATISFKGSSHYSGHYDQPLIYTVMRDKFDYALVRRAEEAGAVIAQGQEVKQIQFGTRWLEVSTPTGDFRAQYLAGADGAHSVVDRESGLINDSSYITAIETEVQVTKEELSRWRSQVLVDLGWIPGGYAWVFPKLDHLSIGVACLSSKAKGLKTRYWKFLDSLNIPHHTIEHWGSSLIPMCGGKAVVRRDRVALLGDAAGLIDPLTGEGIHNAVWSAQLAAPVIEDSLLHGEARLQNYQKAVDEKIMPEIRIARVLSSMFVRFPSLVFKMLNRDERIWRGCCYLLRQEIDYSTIKQRVGGFKGIYSLLAQK
ncbi:NAD(P)/FAD-dependent oxidoreductase, partial [Chloroflexota bacterium]